MNRTTTIVLGLVLCSFLIAPVSYAAPSWWPLVPCGLNQQPDGIDKATNDYTKPCNECDLFKLLKNLIDFVYFGLAPILATLFIVWAGFLIITAGGIPANYAAGMRIFKQVLTGIIFLSLAWIATNTLLKSLANNNISDKWYELTCTPKAPKPSPTVTGPLPTVTADCRQEFNVSPSSGCTDTSSCIDVSNYTSTHGCESNNGVCLLSSGAASRLQSFISTFNSLGGGACSLRTSSTIQVNGGPSSSGCHKAGNNKSGTCADFNILHNETCTQAFYQAARDSGAVVVFLDEYVAACVASTTTGGNIHVQF